MIECFDNKCVGQKYYDTVEPLAKVQRLLKNVKGCVPQSHAVSSYSKYIGGMDHDGSLCINILSIRGKKQYLPLFTRFIDMALDDSQIIYNIIYQVQGSVQLDLSDLKRYIIVTNLKLHCMEVTMGRPSNTIFYTIVCEIMVKVI